MIRELSTRDEVTTSHLGGPFPYWSRIRGTVIVSESAPPIFSLLRKEEAGVDAVAVAEMLEFNYMLGDRTLLQGVRRMPWRATLRGDGSILRHSPIPHGRNIVPAQEAAAVLADLLQDELSCALKDFDRAILMLTGGLDSRVIAGVLKRLTQETTITVETATWGNARSRDVVYARRIAEWFGWKHHHIPYDAETLRRNLPLAAIWGGAEVAPIHFHAMADLRDLARGALVIAASFGDSIGRAEFSSVHLSRLKHRAFRNQNRLIRRRLVRGMKMATKTDRAQAWCGAADDRVARLELDYQENYMRRMISHAFDYVRAFSTLHQAFTADAVVRYMWSLDPTCRNDEIYKQLLLDLDERLYSLPWARTGVSPAGTVETDASLSPTYHSWEGWVRNELHEQLEPLVSSSGPLKEFTFLNSSALSKTHDVETMLKLAGLAVAKNHFEL